MKCQPRIAKLFHQVSVPALVKKLADALGNFGPYLLGLLDTVGELKRLVLNSVMKGDIKRAKKFFGSMEVLYNECSPLAVYDHVVNGTRRKIDVARMLVDDARGLLTEELRREQVTASMDRVSRKLGSRA